MSEDSNNAGNASAGVAADFSHDSMEPGTPAVKSQDVRTLSAAGITAAVAAVALPLLKVRTAEAISQCDFHDLYNFKADLTDPTDCSDCNTVVDPQVCTPEDAKDLLAKQGSDLADFVGDYADIGSDPGS